MKTCELRGETYYTQAEEMILSTDQLKKDIHMYIHDVIAQEGHKPSIDDVANQFNLDSDGMDYVDDILWDMQ